MAHRTGSTIFDAAVLGDLADQLQSGTVARNYARKFMDLLQPRHERILAALGEDDTPASLGAVLSLKVNAHMVGALAVEQTCQSLQRCVLNGDTPAATRHAEALPRDIDAVKDAITKFLSGALH
ncbi:MAG: Hpt domain-containing protein [Arthrobacter oryzae]